MMEKSFKTLQKINKENEPGKVLSYGITEQFDKKILNCSPTKFIFTTKYCSNIFLNVLIIVTDLIKIYKTTTIWIQYLTQIKQDLISLSKQLLYIRI